MARRGTGTVAQTVRGLGASHSSARTSRPPGRLPGPLERFAAVKGTLMLEVTLHANGTFDLKWYLLGQVYVNPLRGRWSDRNNRYVTLNWAGEDRYGFTYESGHLAFYHHPSPSGVVDERTALRFVLQRTASALTDREEATVALIAAVKVHDLDSVRRYARNGGNLNAVDDMGWPMLRYAVFHDQADLAVLLLELGADPDVHDGLGGSPLHAAAEKNRIELARLLIPRGADVNARSISVGLRFTRPHRTVWRNSYDFFSRIMQT